MKTWRAEQERPQPTPVSKVCVVIGAMKGAHETCWNSLLGIYLYYLVFSTVIGRL